MSSSSSSSSSSIKACIKFLTESPSGVLSEKQATEAMTEIMQGKATPSQMGAYLAALTLDRVTPEIVAASAEVMRTHALPCHPDVSTPIIDVVGTGGDGIDTFNVSTTAALVVASAGGHVLKHGNRSNSSKCGSADILESLGARLDVDGTEALEVMRRSGGFCFLFAQKFHPAMRFVGPTRRQMGCRTIFNILGPLTNPARATYYVTGVFHRKLGRLFAQSFVRLGVRKAMVVHSDEGLDEISPAGPTHCWLVDNDVISEMDISPDSFGLPTYELSQVMGGTPEENMQMLRDILDGCEGACLDYVVMNAAAALWVAGMAADLKQAAVMAKDAILSGKTKSVLQGYVDASVFVKEFNAETDETKDQSKESILTKITKQRRQDIDHQQSELPLHDLLISSLGVSVLAPLADPLAFLRHRSDGSVCIMAEIKRASPSKGDINTSVDVPHQALSYAVAGAGIISVLTEPRWFKGSLDDLRKVRETLEVEYAGQQRRPAVLLKDFVVTEYQLYQARAAGADLVLLIVAILDDEEIVKFVDVTHSLGMEALVEVATDNEARRAVKCGAQFIGINNRNLHTFEVDMDRTAHLVKVIRKAEVSCIQSPEDCGVIVASLSGIRTRGDVKTCQDGGAVAVLVGETLMRSDDPAATIRELCGHVAASPIVKVCPHDAKLIVDAVRAEFPQSGLGGIAKLQPAAALGINEAPSSYFSRTEQRLIDAFRTRVGGAPSRVDSDKAKCGRPLFVGVFRNASVEHMNVVAQQVGLDMIQLHGDEGFEIALRLCRPVIRVLHIAAEDPISATDLLGLIKPGMAEFLLLDSSVKGKRGGTGQCFDWTVARKLRDEGSIPVLLAGGLNPFNVCQAIREARPMGVDVSSGVETNCVKDVGKIREFVRQAVGCTLAACDQ